MIKDIEKLLKRQSSKRKSYKAVCVYLNEEDKNCYGLRLLVSNDYSKDNKQWIENALNNYSKMNVFKFKKEVSKDVLFFDYINIIDEYLRINKKFSVLTNAEYVCVAYENTDFEILFE